VDLRRRVDLDHGLADAELAAGVAPPAPQRSIFLDRAGVAAPGGDRGPVPRRNRVGHDVGGRLDPRGHETEHLLAAREEDKARPPPHRYIVAVYASAVTAHAVAANEMNCMRP